MTSTNPAHKPIFKTPDRVASSQAEGKNLNPTPPTAPNQGQDSYLRGESSPQRSQQFNIKITTRSNHPYLDQDEVLETSRFRVSDERLDYEDLLKIVDMYEYQVTILKDYIHESDFLERKRIMDIFGFDFPCYNNAAKNETDQSKLVLKELSQKVRRLIKENNELKKGYKSMNPSLIIRDDNDVAETHLLIKQNEKLRKIIDEMKNFETNDVGKLLDEIEKLRKDNKHLNDQLRKYKLKVESLDQRKSQEEATHGKPKIISQKLPIKKSNVPNASNVSNASNASNAFQDDIDYSKKQLAKQIFEYSKQMQDIMAKNNEKIDMQERRIQEIEQQLRELEMVRMMKIESTIRKSFRDSDNIYQPRGDDGEYPRFFLDESLARKQSGKIRIISKEPIAISESDQSPNSELLRQELKQIKQSLLMQQMKTKNITDQNSKLKYKLTELEQKISQKIQRNIKLQGMLTKLEEEKERQSEGKLNMVQDSQKAKTHEGRAQGYKTNGEWVSDGTTNDDLQMEVREIIEILKACNIINYELFFKEINEILEQRKLYKDTIETYQNASGMYKSQQEGSQAKKNARKALEQKINQLTEENTRLLQRISDLEAEVERYHNQIIFSEIEKLNSLTLDQKLQPSGESAIEWQKSVKINIQGALERLESLQKKINETQKARKDGIFMLKAAETSKYHSQNLSQSPQPRRLGPKQNPV